MPALPELSIAHYRHFLLVAELRSFRAAAARAFRSQPALSLSIREMEQRLGQPLFERGNGNALTRFGQDCLPLARELVEHHDRVAGTLAGLAGNEAGTLTMASVATVAMHWLPELVAAYRERYPAVALRLFDDNSEGVERMVLAGEVELGVCSPVLRDRRLAFEPLLRDAFGLVCHRGHPLAGRKSVTWREIAGLPLVGTVAHRQLADYPQAAFMMERQVFVSNMMSLLAMLERGVGVTVLARLGVPPDSPGLVFVPLARPRIERELGITRLAGRSLSPAAARMEEMLRAKAARGGRSVA
ncbi:LysR family transcriptional regulator [Achromobacter xylosoxidans]|uniref:LysR family transcriptional regulator n=1 Tax=Alcaligenes xylosoxydans xylosoxydans TaxID=85698 RepID=UPI0022B93B8F|nr:LysR family transcriptional regulator [Achromobacter xylosoxidans]MCZ8440420.1 LysR substrate-binding domain-containing protein [Achromobacter xylosoxidans]